MPDQPLDIPQRRVLRTFTQHRPFRPGPSPRRSRRAHHIQLHSPTTLQATFVLPQDAPMNFSNASTRSTGLEIYQRYREGTTSEIVKRSDQAKGFILLPKRWVVERTLAWLNRCRRLAKDWECLNRRARAFLILASIRLMARRLGRVME